MASGTIVFGAVLLLAWGLVCAGTFVELTGCGDKPELKGKDESGLLYEAAKFRRLSQYESVLL